ncbi:MAG: hypothetical protein ABI868_15705 [Acidobacteriota bacterium]
MTRRTQVHTIEHPAPELPPQGDGPGDRLRAQQTALAEELVARQFAAQPELARRDGPAGREACLQEANYQLACLSAAMNAGNASLFSDYVGWAKVMLGRRGVSMADLARHLELTRTIVGERFEGAARSLAVAYLSAGLAVLPSLPIDLPSCLPRDAPHAGLAAPYLDALLNGERELLS